MGTLSLSVSLIYRNYIKVVTVVLKGCKLSQDKSLLGNTVILGIEYDFIENRTRFAFFKVICYEGIKTVIENLESVLREFIQLENCYDFVCTVEKSSFEVSEAWLVSITT